MQDLIEILLGVENFYYFMNDYTDEMEALMEHMLEVRLDLYRALADCPAPIVITGENTSTTLASPDYMARYEFPALDAYSEIVHRTGKIHLAHMCGKLHRVVDLLEACQLDGLHDVAPAPTGDFDFHADLARLRAAGKSVAGGIDATAFVGLDPEGLEAYIIERLAEAAPGTGFLLSSGDTVPLGTTEENLRQVMRTLEQYGKYPLQ
jgi:uroporphyrinogen-III decarboxylase